MTHHIFYYKNWMEIWFFALMVLGALFAIITPSAVISYFIAIAAGFFGGRFYHARKQEKQSLPYLVLMTGFALGFGIGVYYGNRYIVVLMFLVGGILGYHLFNKGILKDTQF
jgi:hypothetical protein